MVRNKNTKGTGILFPSFASGFTNPAPTMSKCTKDMVVGALCQPEHSIRLCGDIEPTYYTGLLHHLAGTLGAMEPLLQRRQAGTTVIRLRQQLTRSAASASFLCHAESVALIEDILREGRDYFSIIPQLPTMTKLLSFPIRTVNSLDERTEQSACVSHAFVFAALIRGPPNPAG